MYENVPPVKPLSFSASLNLKVLQMGETKCRTHPLFVNDMCLPDFSQNEEPLSWWLKDEMRKSRIVIEELKQLKPEVST